MKKFLTIDTNRINAYGKDLAMNELERLHREGKIELLKTHVMDTETQGSYQRGLEKASQYREDLGVGIWGHFRWGHAVYANREEGKRFSEIRNTLFGFRSGSEAYTKQEIRDVIALMTHLGNNRDYFVTHDSAFLKKRKDLGEKFGAIVCTSRECLTLLKEYGIE